MSQLSYAGAFGAAGASAAVENVHANVATSSSQGDFGTIAGNAQATQFDMLFIDLDGVPVTAGTIQVDAEVTGFIEEQGNGSNGSGSWYFRLGGVDAFNGFEATGDHQMEATLTAEISGPDGVLFELSVTASAYGLGFNDTNASANFTAVVTETRYYTPTGVLNPNANFTFASSLFLPGDYNNDHIVSATDYTVWRDNLGADINLPNDITPGSVDAGDYDVWETNFGRTSIEGAGSGGAVPEPASLVLLLLVIVVVRLNPILSGAAVAP